MEKEYLYLSHLATENGLVDFNMNIYQGEIICLMGMHGSGRSHVRGVLEGRISLTGGKIWFGADPAQNYDERAAYIKGIDCIDTKERLVGSLSIADNIFALRRSGRHPMTVYNSRFSRTETERLLQMVGLDHDPSTPVYKLSLFEQRLVCIAKALSHNAKILIIDGIAAKMNYVEQICLKSLLRQLASSKGISFLLIDDKPNELLEVARKVVLIRRGRDIKTVLRPELRPFDQQRVSHLLMSYLTDHPSESKIETPEKEPGKTVLSISSEDGCIPLHAGTICGLFDIMRDSDNSFLQFLQKMEKDGILQLPGGSLLNCADEETLRRQGAVYIPQDSGEMLIEHLSITENMAVPSYRRLSSFGVINPRMVKKISTDYRKEFNISEELEDVKLLHGVQRRILSIRRWMWRCPPILFLENPLTGLDVSNIQTMCDYLKKLAASGALVVVTTTSLFEMSLMCDEIICTNRGKFWHRYPRAAFGKIQTDLSEEY